MKECLPYQTHLEFSAVIVLIYLSLFFSYCLSLILFSLSHTLFLLFSFLLTVPLSLFLSPSPSLTLFRTAFLSLFLSFFHCLSVLHCLSSVSSLFLSLSHCFLSHCSLSSPLSLLVSLSLFLCISTLSLSLILYLLLILSLSCLSLSHRFLSPSLSHCSLFPVTSSHYFQLYRLSLPLSLSYLFLYLMSLPLSLPFSPSITVSYLVLCLLSSSHQIACVGQFNLLSVCLLSKTFHITVHYITYLRACVVWFCLLFYL